VTALRASRIRPSVAELALGAHLALDNAERLLDAASVVVNTDKATASYLVAMASEEIGKGVILTARWRVFDGQGHYPEGLLDEVLADPDVLKSVNVAWGDFYKREFTYHAQKTAAFFSMLSAVVGDPVIYQQPDANTLVEVRPVGGLEDSTGKGVAKWRNLVEGSVYLDWDASRQKWVTPKPLLWTTPHGKQMDTSEFCAYLQRLLPEFRAQVPPTPTTADGC